MASQYMINGKSNESLTPLDRGFAYGDGVFRTLAVRNGVPLSWDRHYRKLHDDCNALGIVCPPYDTLLADVRHLCSKNDNAAVKIIVTRGEGLRGYAVPPLAQPNRVVLKSALPNYPSENYTNGIALHLCQLRLSQQPRLAGIKHLNRLENVLARMEWVDPKIADGLLLDYEGNVIECTMSNVFIRSGTRLKTPDLSRCGVRGVTRDRIIELAPEIGLSVEISAMALNELLEADEVLICNTLIGVWQVRSLEKTSWQAGDLAGRLCTIMKEQDARIF